MTVKINEMECKGAKLWEKEYKRGGNSGTGSYGEFADFKARILNDLVSKEDIRTVIEFGCGDGNQLSLATYPMYIGYDVSPTALALCHSKFAADSTKAFRPVSEYQGEKADMAMSLDVLYHIIEHDLWEAYMRRLFNAAYKCVVIYSTNEAYNAPNRAAHMYHRQFTPWVEANQPAWELVRTVRNEFNGSADFYIYKLKAKI